MPKVDPTQHLPIELLHRVADYLPASQLLLVSSVSKRFRGVMAGDPRFHIPIRLEVTLDNICTNVCSRQVAHAHAVLAYAIPQRLAVALTVAYHLGQSIEVGGCYSDSVSALLRSYMYDAIFPIIRIALPVLVRLAVTIPDEYSHALHAALLQPAPALRELKLSRTFTPDILQYDAEALVHVVPPNIFAGVAPQLSRVSLCNVAFADGPIPAFVSARRVALLYDYHAPVIRIALLFPRVAELEIHFDASDSILAPPAKIDYRGLSLRHLSVGDTAGCGLLDTMATDIAIAQIPTITYTSCLGSLSDHETLTGHLPGSLNIHLKNSTGSGSAYEVQLCAVQADLQRVFRFDGYDLEDGDPFCHFNSCASRIVDIRLEYELLCPMLQFRCDLPVLCRLRIDLSEHADFSQSLWFPYSDESDSDSKSETGCSRGELHCSTQYLLRCPMLDSIAFVGRYCSRIICSRQVAFIGQAFGQLERSPQARARLEMIGVTFWSDTPCPLLDDVFPIILYKEFNKRSFDSDEVAY